MRIDSEAFQDQNTRRAKDPRYVVAISFDDAHTEVEYFASHDDAAYPVGASVTLGVVEKISGTLQRINPDDGTSEIGAINVSLVDYQGQITGIINTHLNSSRGLRRKRLQVWVGYEPLAWDDYMLVTTQLIEGVDYEKGGYDIRCMDVQRTLKEKIFLLKKTNLSATISATATTIPSIVGSLSEFLPVFHGPSYSDAPNATVGYIRIDDEIIRCTTANNTTGEFTGCTRGVLGTRAVAHEIDPDASADRQTEIEEVVYLELPDVKLAYALLTGSLYGDGASLPDHWHLGIPSEYVATSKFVGIGDDLWTTTDDTAGKIARFVGLDEEDGKKFIEQEIMQKIGCYMPILSDGALGLRRMTGVLSSASATYTLDESNSVAGNKLTHDMKEVANRLLIRWNWREDLEKFTREHYLLDFDSINTHGDADLKIMEYRGLHGSRHTYGTLTQLFDALRDRYAGPPLLHSRELLPSTNMLEVGDVVRVKDSNIRDWNTDASIDRAMEIQSIQVDWTKGRVSVELFGSSQKASPLTDAIDGGYATVPSTAIPDAWYISSGTNLASIPEITITDISGIGHITAVDPAYVLPAGTYYYDGELTLDAGVVLPFEGTAYLRVKGFFQVDGKLDGAGRGFTGGLGSSTANGGWGGAAGTAGYLGDTQGGGAQFIWHFDAGVTDYLASVTSLPMLVTDGPDAVPPVGAEWDGSNLIGLPSDLRGTSGGAGGNVRYSRGTAPDVNSPTVTAVGGDGGPGGAGMCIVCRGAAFGGSGEIDVSGGDGTLGGTYAVEGETFYAGTGGGGSPGAVLLIADGQSALITVGAQNITALRPAAATQGGVAPEPFQSASPFAEYCYYTGGYELDMSIAAHRVQYLLGQQTAETDVSETTDDAAAVTVTEYTNTPKSPAGNLSSLEVSVTPPSAGNYAYSNIYYRIYGSGSAWTFSGPVDANGEWVIVVDSDGTRYEIEARSVSIAGVENDTGPRTDITTTSVDDPYTISAPIGLAADSGTAHLLLANDGTILSRIYFSWTAVTHDFLDGYDVQYKKSTETAWTGAERVSDTEYYAAGVKDGDDYDLRVRAGTSVAASAWTTLSNHTVIGKTAPPPDVTGFRVQQNGPSIVMRWQQVPATPDLGGYRIRHAPAGTGSWSKSTLVTDGVSGTIASEGSIPPGLYDFWIKAVDTSGNESTTATKYPNVRVISDYDEIVRADQHPTWPGLKDGYVLHTSGVLVPTSQSLASATGWDVFDIFVYDPVPESVYITPEIDSDYDDWVRVWAEATYTPGPGETGEPEHSLELGTRVTGGTHSGADNTIDYGLTTESVTVTADYGLTTESVTVTDNYGYVPETDPWGIGNVETRYATQLLRAPNVSGSVAYLEALTAIVDLQERTERHIDVVIAASGTAVTFDNPFHQTPFISSTAQGSAARYITRENPTPTGVTFHVWDGTGTEVGGTIDYEAKGT